MPIPGAVDEWKKIVVRQLGLSLLDLKPEDWIVLLLAADGYSPISGEESMHTCFFLYSLCPFNFKTLLITVYSSDLHRALSNLIERGIVKRSMEYVDGDFREVFKLTDDGRVLADSLKLKLSRSWVFVNNIVLRRGDSIMEELASLKRTYNERKPSTLLKLILNNVESSESILELRLSEDEVDYLKKVYKYYQRESRRLFR